MAEMAGYTPESGLWSAQPERMLSTRYGPYLRRLGFGAAPCALDQVDAIAHYEAGYMVPGSRAISDAVTETLARSFSKSQTVSPSPAGELFHRLYATEVIDVIRLFGQPCLAILRGTGSLANPQQGIEFLHPDLAQLLEQEVALVQRSIVKLTSVAPRSELVTTNSPRPEGLAELVALSAAIAELPVDIYSELYRTAPPGPVGLEPMFRSLSPAMILNASIFEFRGFRIAKEMEPFGEFHDSVVYVQNEGELPDRDKLFIPFLSLRNLQSLRLKGVEIFDHCVEVGERMLDSGLVPDVKNFIHPEDGVQLANGDVARIKPRVAYLLAYDRHANWMRERERSFHLDDKSLRQREDHPCHESWPTNKHPDERYISDVRKAYGFSLMLAQMKNSGRPETRELFQRIRASCIPAVEGQYNRTSLENLFSVATGVQPKHLQVPAVEVQHFAQERFSTGFLWAEAREPGELRSEKQRDWKELPKARKLFELNFAAGVLSIVSRLSESERAELYRVGAKLLDDPVETRRGGPNPGHEILLRSGERVEMGAKVLEQLVSAHSAQWQAAREHSFDIAALIRDRSLQPPGKPSANSKIIPATEMNQRLFDKNAGLVYNLSFVLAALHETNEQTFSHLAERVGWPALSTVRPLAEVLERSYVARLADAVTEAREVLSPKAEHTRGDQLHAFLLAPALVDLARLLGREAILHLQTVGARMHQYGIIPPEHGKLSSWDSYTKGAKLREIHETVRLSPSFAEESARLHHYIYDQTKQLTGVFAAELQDRSLRARGVRPGQPHRQPDIRMLSSEELDRDRVGIYALAYALGGQTLDELQPLLEGAYTSGQVLRHKELRDYRSPLYE